MARVKTAGNGRLEEAIRDMLKAHTALAQTQAALQAQMVESKRLRAEAERRFDEFVRRFNEYERINNEQFARIHAILLDHSRILAEHTHILERLPDAVRERMGFPIPERRGSPQ